MRALQNTSSGEASSKPQSSVVGSVTGLIHHVLFYSTFHCCSHQPYTELIPCSLTTFCESNSALHRLPPAVPLAAARTARPWCSDGGTGSEKQCRDGRDVLQHTKLGVPAAHASPTPFPGPTSASSRQTDKAQTHRCLLYHTAHHVRIH